MADRDDLEALLPHAKPLSWFRPGRRVAVADKMQSRYSYRLTEPAGRNFGPGFRPKLTPAQVLRRGAFEGKYLNDCVLELPREVVRGRPRPASSRRPGPPGQRVPDQVPEVARLLAPERVDPAHPQDRDVRGWFQWLSLLYRAAGSWRRRRPDRPLKSFVRHAGQIRASYRRGGRPKMTEKRAPPAPAAGASPVGLQPLRLRPAPISLR